MAAGDAIPIVQLLACYNPVYPDPNPEPTD